MVNRSVYMMRDMLSDSKWRRIVKEAMDSGVSKEQFRTFLDEKQKKLNHKEDAGV